ncbi:HD family phosphohydrolase [Caldibacillus lycopersici]|uniref:HD family phosphohydrolase n=2 Tax=Perspicuibacillus lycopersici TaxID=1325689 RepID=A0AAE3LNJ4_9BACI|nr:HD family phosphohydrolase [Perspicuibacillus lycopersici]
MYSNVNLEPIDVQKFGVSEHTIISPITMEDTELTEKKKQDAVNQVQPVYELNQEYAQNMVDLVSDIFTSAIEIVEEINQAKKDASLNLSNEDNEGTAYVEPSVSQKVNMLKEKLTDDVNSDLSNTTLAALVTSSKTELSMAKDAVVTAVNNAMTKRISASEVENAKKRVEDEIRYSSLSQDLKNAAIELGRYATIQNEYYDPEATEVARQQAIENIEPVRILQGQIIVEEGQLVTQEIYRQLDLLGLLDTKERSLPYFGLFLFVTVLVGFIYSFFYREIQKPEMNKKLLLFSVVLIISIIFMKIISLLPFTSINMSYVYPAAMCVMLMKILLNERMAIMSAILLSACSTVIFNGSSSGSFNYSVGLYILISGLSGIIFLTNQNHRSKIFQAGLFVSLINMVIIAALLFIPNSQFTYLQYIYYFVFGIGSGLASAVLTIGLLPFFEAGFGILSTMKLIELSNPNHPLLKKILTETPGTYHHSVMVANLAEAACEAIGADGLLARVCCYYHDIGKTRRPSFFVENQGNMENPHDRLAPEISKEIIIAHTTDGANILQKHRMPKDIVDVARQHHGTSLLKFFYYKAKELGIEVKEEDYRYPGPKPQTKETAIINIADSVEAAVRSMANPNMEKIESLVKNIIKDRLHDDQFNECDITLKELKMVEKTLCETLHGIFHNRIEYPELKEER